MGEGEAGPPMERKERLLTTAEQIMSVAEKHERACTLWNWFPMKETNMSVHDLCALWYSCRNGADFFLVGESERGGRPSRPLVYLRNQEAMVSFVFSDPVSCVFIFFFNFHVCVAIHMCMQVCMYMHVYGYVCKYDCSHM